MTMQREVELECPKCGQKQPVTLWDAINVSTNPELKSKLFNGQINVFSCFACSHRILIPMPLLYHDMERKFIVYHFPLTFLSKEEDVRKTFNQDGRLLEETEPLPQALRDYYDKMHVVFDMDELLRYVYFRERVIEVWTKVS
jgi:DNA-directed RNA polymerase subunit RPC12/RpoP